MHAKGISLIYQYDEGFDLDFDIGLYFYEKLCKFCEDPKNAKWRNDYPRSQPIMMTAIKRKQVRIFPEELLLLLNPVKDAVTEDTLRHCVDRIEDSMVTL
jgi:hypothetical protein